MSRSIYADESDDDLIRDEENDGEGDTFERTIKIHVDDVIFRKRKAPPFDHGQTLSKAQKAELKKCEADIEMWEKGSLPAGLALVKIWENRLYRDKHGTFEAYLHGKWDMSRARGYQIITAGLAYRGICKKIKHPPPTRIASLLALKNLYADQAAQVYDYAWEIYQKEPTAAAIKEAISRLKEEEQEEYLNGNEGDDDEEDEELVAEEKEDEPEGEEEDEGDVSAKKSPYVTKASRYARAMRGILKDIDYANKGFTHSEILKADCIAIREMLVDVIKGIDERVVAMSTTEPNSVASSDSIDNIN